MCRSMCENARSREKGSVVVVVGGGGRTHMCCEALGKCSAYCGAESSGPWGAAWLMTIMTGRWG